MQKTACWRAVGGQCEYLDIGLDIVILYNYCVNIVLSGLPSVVGSDT